MLAPLFRMLQNHLLKDNADQTAFRLTFFGPINAVVNLFIYILKHPENPRIQSDIALLNIGAGHFARLEFATDAEISFPFVTEIAALAREAVKKARSNLLRPQERSTVNVQDDLEQQLGTGEIAEIDDGNMRIDGDEFYDDEDVNCLVWSLFIIQTLWNWQIANVLFKFQTYSNNEINCELDIWSLMLPFPAFDDKAPEFLISWVAAKLNT